MSEPQITIGLTEDQAMLRDLVRDVVKNEVVPVRMELDEKNEYPHKVLEKFKEAGLFQAMYEEEFGGMGMGMMGNIILAEEVAERQSSFQYHHRR